MMKKRVAMLVSLVFAIGLVFMAFTGCKVESTWKVEFYDGDEVIKTVQVAKDGFVDNYVPNPKGEFVFDKWYASPSLKVLFDFTKPITKDIKIFGSFRSNVEDTRVWELAGSGSAEPLKSNNWGKGNAANIAASTFVKTDGANEFVITVTLYPDDLFQIAVVDHADNHSWKIQQGGQTLKNPGENFLSVEGIDSAAPANIKVLKAGVYKFTLSTDAKNASLNSISYMKVGEAPPLVPVITPIVSGNINSSGIYDNEKAAKASGLYLAQVGTTKIYEGVINFNENDFFCILPYNNWGKKLTAGDVTADSDNVVVAKTDVEKQGNIVITKTGKFKIALNMTDEKAATVKINRTADFEFDAAKHNVVNVCNAAGEIQYKYYVTRGGKMISSVPKSDSITAGKAFAGWYNGENAFSFNTAFNVAGLTIDLIPKEITDSEKDGRSYVIYGTGITGEPSWSNGSALTFDNVHTYTKDITFAAAGGQLTLKEKIGVLETGLTIKRINVTGITTDETIIKMSPGNIMFAKAGTFTLSFNSFTQVLTITEKAA